jgi:predicted phosphoribosyltransferase
MGPLFQDRRHAGKELAQKVRHHANDAALLVLALPRGGVPVAFEVATELKAPLDVFVVRKLGVPGHEELAMGAVASGDVRVLNEDVIRRLSIPPSAVDAVAQEEQEELVRGEKAFRGSRPAVPIAGRTVILVDDGLATGASMRAAVRALRQKHPARIVVAVPVGSPETCDQFQQDADELIYGDTPEPFFSVGAWYANFLPITDGEVQRLLDHAAHERRIQRVQEHRAVAQ